MQRWSKKESWDICWCNCCIMITPKTRRIALKRVTPTQTSARTLTPFPVFLKHPPWEKTGQRSISSLTRTHTNTLRSGSLSHPPTALLYLTRAHGMYECVCCRRLGVYSCFLSRVLNHFSVFHLSSLTVFFFFSFSFELISPPWIMLCYFISWLSFFLASYIFFCVRFTIFSIFFLLFVLKFIYCRKCFPFFYGVSFFLSL